MKKNLIFCALLLLCKVAASQKILHVNAPNATSGDGSSWTNAYTTLSAALAEAHKLPSADSIVIKVAKGSYYPKGLQTDTQQDTSFTITRGRLAILGGYSAGSGTRDAAANLTTLSGDIGIVGDTADNSYHVVVVVGVDPATAGGITIDGFTIAHGNANINR